MIRCKYEIINALLLCIILNLTTNTAEARVYAYIDKNGYFYKLSKESSNEKTQSNDYNKSIKTARKSKIIFDDNQENYNDRSSAISVDELIQIAASKNSVDPLLIRAVIKTESNFDREAISSKGAQGLMQLMPQTARELHVAHPFDPAENITGGTKYLRSLLENYNGKIELSLAAYNAGPGNVKDQIPDIPETKHYVSKVMGHYKKYKNNQQLTK